MKICINCSWEKPSIQEYGSTLVYMNKYLSDAGWVVDLCSRPKSELSQKFPKKKRIYVAGEPTPLMFFGTFPPSFFNEFYSIIFAWHRAFEGLPKFHRFRFGTSWVTWEPDPLKFGISGIFSGKSNGGLPGYSIRRKIESLESKITIPSMVYSPNRSWKGISYQYPVKDKRAALNHMFHWAIENIPEPGYFTEKLIDCLVCGVVPVYYGDPDIGEVFDERGIIRFDESDIAGQANSLTPELYEEMLPYIDKNRTSAQPYRNLVSNVIRHIEGLNDAEKGNIHSWNTKVW